MSGLAVVTNEGVGFTTWLWDLVLRSLRFKPGLPS